MSDQPSRFVVLDPSGRTEFGLPVASDARSMFDAVRPYVGHVGTQGMGVARAFFTDDFSELPTNALADRVLSGLGYHHPTGWRGVVVLTMEEDSAGDFAPLSPELVAVVRAAR